MSTLRAPDVLPQAHKFRLKANHESSTFYGVK
jgi:hypothetical protein